MKDAQKILAIILILLALSLIWFNFFKPKVELVDWKISNNGNFYLDTLIPHYSYHTIIPYIYFKGDLLYTAGVGDYTLDLTMDGCFMEVKVNDEIVHENKECYEKHPLEHLELDLAGKLREGRNNIEISIMFDGGTTRFEIHEQKKFNMLRFALALLFLSIAFVLLDVDRKLLYTLLLLSLVFIHVYSTWFSVNWGYDALESYSRTIVVVLALLSMLIAFPQSYSYLEKNLPLLVKKLKRKIKFKFKWKWPKDYARLKAPLMYASMSVISFIIFWFFRTKTSLGDSGFVGNIPLDRVYMFFATSPLTAFIVTKAYDFSRFLGFEYNSYETTALVAAVFGALSIPALWLICKQVVDSWRKSIFLFSLVASAYFMQLFFGYIEFYPTLLAAMIFYTLACVYYLKDKVSLLVPSIAFALMFCIHLSGGYLGISLIVIYLVKVSSGKENLVKGFLKIALPAALIFILFFGYVIFGYSNCQGSTLDCIVGYIHALKGSDPGFFRSDALTLTFLQELLTEYIYIAPQSLIIALFIAFYMPFKVNYRDPFVQYMFASAAGFFIYTVTHMTGTGLPNDWDVLAPIGLPLTLLLGYMLINVLDKKKNLRELNYLFISVILVSLLIHTVPSLLDAADMEYFLSEPWRGLSEMAIGVSSIPFSFTSLQAPSFSDLEPLDVINIGNTESEREHSYSISGELEIGSRETTYLDGTKVVDNYRSFDNQESFIADSIPGEDLYIVARFYCPTDQVRIAYLHGSYLGKLDAECLSTDPMWKDVYVRAPANLIQGSKVGLMFVAEHEEPAESYTYWVYTR